MKKFFEKPTEKISGLSNIPKEVLFYRVMPRFLLDLMTNYFRVEVEGAEHLPLSGPCLVTPNHSGFSGLDALVLGHQIYRHVHRIPRVLTHHLWFMSRYTSIPMQKMGFVEATSKNASKFLKKDKIVVLFPEGEYGNFKPSNEKYTLQEFRRGFVRLAIQNQVPIVPSLILGAEESHINLKQIELSKFLKGTTLPLPLNVIPLPSKWKIKFLEPIELPFKPDASNDTELVHEVSLEIKERMQLTLHEELRKRDFIFFEGWY